MTENTVKIKILIVEDDVRVAKDLDFRLNSLGYLVCGTATTGRESLEFVKHHHPDLVVIDVVLPGEMDGIDVANIMKERWALPFVFLATDTDAGRLDRSKSTYPFGHIHYPFEDRELKASLETVLYVADLEVERRKSEEERENAERKLREIEKKYRSIFDNIQDVYMEVASDGIILEVSPSIARLSGYNREEVLGRSVTDFYVDPVESRTLWDTLRLQGSVNDHEVRLRAKNGGVMVCSCSVKALLDTSGALIEKNVGTMRDITDRKQMEEALQESEEKFRRITENVRDTIYRMSLPDGRYEYVSPASEQLFGYTPQEFYDSPMLVQKIIHPDWMAYFEEQWSNLIKGDMPPYYEYQFLDKSGETRWANQRNVLIKDDNGRPIAIDGVVTDITARKLAEEELRESEKKYQNLAENPFVGIFRTSLEDGTFLYSNKKNAEIVGYDSPEDLIEKKIKAADFYSPGVRAELLDALQRDGRVEDFVVELNIQNKKKIISISAVLWPEEKYLEGVIIDITERKRSEEALRESEERFRVLVECAPFGLSLMGPDHQFRFFNQQFTNITGYTLEDIPNKNRWLIKAYPDPEYRKQVASTWRAGLGNGLRGREINSVFKIRCKDGQEKSINFFAVSLKDGSQLLSYEDITDRKRAEEERAINMLRIQALLQLNQMGDATLPEITDFALEEAVRLTQSKIGYLAFLNEDDSALTMHSWSKSAMQECAIADKPIYYPVVNTGLWGEAVRQRRPIITNDYSAANPWKKGLPQGHVFLQRHMNAPIFNGDKIVAVAGVGNKETEYTEADVYQISLLMQGMWRLIEKKSAEEEREKLRTQLAQAQKMEAIGILAGGISHDFNNLLQAINGYTELLLMKKDPKDMDYYKLLSIQNAGEKAAHLVQQLLFFSRKAETKYLPVNLNQQIEQARHILGRTIPKMVDIDVILDSRLWIINGDSVQLEQILLNLGKNAADAMPDGGKLTIETKNVILEEQYDEKLRGDYPGHYILLTVSDTGHGMDKETVKHIFEPFYTTKDIGKGTGLGLASVYGIVKNHGGNITCYSEVGMGTTFNIYLPAIEQTDIHESKKVEAKPYQGGTETILLVDDEESIRDFATELLKEFGYTVMTASTGEDALRLYSAKSKEIDLVVMDLGMPGMGGHKCLQEMMQIDPAVKVIIASGYSMEGQVKKSLEAGAAGYVGKPYQISDFLEKVRTVLDQHCKGAGIAGNQQ